MTTITATLQSFFTDRLLAQQQASPHTIASYRDTLRMLLEFLHARIGKPPSRLDWSDLDVEAIAAFLDHLQTVRHNSARTRNLRLTAIRSLFAYASLRHPEHAEVIARVLAIPPKRFDKATITSPQRRRGHRIARRARPKAMGRPARPDLHPARHPDRAAPL